DGGARRRGEDRGLPATWETPPGQDVGGPRSAVRQPDRDVDGDDGQAGGHATRALDQGGDVSGDQHVVRRAAEQRPDPPGLAPVDAEHRRAPGHALTLGTADPPTCESPGPQCGPGLSKTIQPEPEDVCLVLVRTKVEIIQRDRL